MTIKENVKILQCNSPDTLSGLIYPRDEVEKAISAAETQLLGLIDPYDAANSTVISLDKVAFIASNLRINDEDEVLADIKTLETPQGKILESFLDYCTFTSVKTGIISHGTASNLTFLYICALQQPGIESIDKARSEHSQVTG